MARKETTTTKSTTAKSAKATTPVVEKETVVSEIEEVQPEIEEAEVEIKEAEPVEIKTSKKKVKQFEPEDMILCESVASGATFVKGIKSGQIYTFENRGAEEYIEYRDLVAGVRTRSSILFKPFIMVLDQDFINEQTKLKDFYESMYTPADFEEFFRIKPSQMKEALDAMPEGVKDTIKNMARTKIEQKTLDSVQKIKLLDEYFGTKLMLLTGLYDD